MPACLHLGQHVDDITSMIAFIAYSFTRLDNVNTDVFNTSVYLLPDEWRRRNKYVFDASRILSRQSRGSCHGITPVCCEDFLIGLKPAMTMSHGSELTGVRL